MKAMVLGYASGLRYDTIPTTSNLALLSYALHRNPELIHLPFILQSELAKVASVLFPNIKIEKVIFTGQEGKVYRADTEEITRQGIKHAMMHGYDTVYILAVPIVHRQFCCMLAKRYAGGKIKVKTVRTGWIPNDPTSIQWFCRNTLFLLIYPLVRIVRRVCHYDNVSGIYFLCPRRHAAIFL